MLDGEHGQGVFLVHTIDNQADEVSSEQDLLKIVHRVWNLRGIRVIGPRRVRHGPGVHEGGIR